MIGPRRLAQAVVCESHDRIGGCAHGFTRRTKAGEFHFDSGPSLFSGCSEPSSNPLRQVLDAVGESPEWRQYDEWTMCVRRAEIPKTDRGDAATATWIFRGDESRRRRRG